MSVLENSTIKVAIVEDQSSVREYLNLYLSEIPELSVVGLATNGKEAITVVEKCLPDIVLMDIDMPLMDGIKAAKIISKRFSHIKILLLTGTEDKQLLSLALEAGAKGYILKTANSNDLGKIIYLIAQGYLQFGPVTTDKIYLESESTVFDAAYERESSSIFLDSDIHIQKAVLNISQHISEIEKSVEFQQEEIRRLINVKIHRQQRRRFTSLENLLSLILDLHTSYVEQKKLNVKVFVLFAWGFISGVSMAAIIIAISAVTG